MPTVFSVREETRWWEETLERAFSMSIQQGVHLVIGSKMKKNLAA